MFISFWCYTIYSTRHTDEKGNKMKQSIAPKTIMKQGISPFRIVRQVEVMPLVLLPCTELVLPPRINELYDPYEYQGKDGRKHLGLRLSPEGRGYIDKILWQVNSATVHTRGLIGEVRDNKKRFLAFSTRCYYPSWRTDVDAGLKALQDAICKLLDINDNRVIKHDIEKYVENCRPGVLVEVREARHI